MAQMVAVSDLVVTEKEIIIMGVKGIRKDNASEKSKRPYYELKDAIKANPKIEVFGISSERVAKIFGCGIFTIHDFATNTSSKGINTGKAVGNMHHHSVLHFSAHIGGRTVQVVVFKIDTIGDKILLMNTDFTLA